MKKGPDVNQDYERGYDQALSEAAASVQAMDRKLSAAMDLINALVRASGGSVFVGREVMRRQHADDVLVQEEDLEQNGWMFSVRPKPKE